MGPDGNGSDGKESDGNESDGKGSDGNESDRNESDRNWSNSIGVGSLVLQAKTGILFPALLILCAEQCEFL